MPQGFLNISHNFAGNGNFVIVEWVKSTASGTPVIGFIHGTGLGVQNDTNATEAVYPAPHINEQLQVINLPEVWFLVRFWQSADGISKDSMILELAGNARTGALFPINRYEYVVDRGGGELGVWADPVQDDQGIRDTRLKDATYWIQERGTGDLLEAEIVDRSDLGGGFDFNNTSKYMESGGVYIAYVIARIDAAGEDTGGGPVLGSGVYPLTEDKDFDPITMSGKTLLALFPGLIGTLTIPGLATLADSEFSVTTHGGSQRNVVIQLDVGDTVNFMGEDVNKIILGKGEEIRILILDNVMYVLERNTSHDKLGQVVWSYKTLPNTIEGDGVQRAIADFPRVLELLESMPANVVVSETDWQVTTTIDGVPNVPINKGRWMYDGTNFRPPDLRDRMFKGLAALDGTVYSGRYEHQKMMTHGHNLSNNNDNGGNPHMSSAHSTGGNLGYGLNGSSSIPDRFRSGPPISIADGSSIGATEQKVNNIGLYPLIVI